MVTLFAKNVEDHDLLLQKLDDKHVRKVIVNFYLNEIFRYSYSSWVTLIEIPPVDVQELL